MIAEKKDPRGDIRDSHTPWPSRRSFRSQDAAMQLARADAPGWTFLPDGQPNKPLGFRLLIERPFKRWSMEQSNY